MSPAAATCGVAKVATVESKTKSPWKPMRLAPPVVVESINVVFTGSMITVEMGTEVSKVSVGRDTVICGGVAVAVAVGVEVAVAVAVGVEVAWL